MDSTCTIYDTCHLKNTLWGRCGRTTTAHSTLGNAWSMLKESQTSEDGEFGGGV